MFSNEDGGTCVTDLKPITIEFKDVFQPLPKSLLEKVICIHDAFFFFLLTMECFATVQGPTNVLFSELWKCFSATQQQE